MREVIKDFVITRIPESLVIRYLRELQRRVIDVIRFCDTFTEIQTYSINHSFFCSRC